MIACTLQEITDVVGGRVLQDISLPITGISTDSRTVGEGQLFIPLRGEKFDGHAYLTAALQDGAAAALTAERPTELLPGKGYVQVEDTQQALHDLAAWYRGKFTLPVVQITGSVGKTTTKEIIACVLARRFNTLKTQANFNNHVGTPQTILGLLPGHEVAVIETGMNHFGEIRYLGEMVKPDIAVITNIGDAHIENLGGTRQGTLKAKCEIFENLKKSGVAVLNGDDELLKDLDLPFETLLCGKGDNCTVRVSNVVSMGVRGVTCTVTTPKDVYDVDIPHPGTYMLYPVSMAIAIGERLGMRKDEILRGIADYRPVGSRMHVIYGADRRIVLDDCYNANPQSMATALKILSETAADRHAAVLGDMGELGDLTEKAHRDLGDLTRELGMDEVIAIGPKAKAIMETNPEAQWFSTIEEALPAIHTALSVGTAMLVKASHAMQFEKIVKELE